MRQRIWELDAFRGICILGMVVVHFCYDLDALYQLQLPWVYDLALQWGGVLFLLLSGLCATLGKHHIRRGIVVFLCGMLCTAVTAGMYLLGLASKGIVIYFGVLHCLGTCMLLWMLLRKLPLWALAAIGIVLAAAGLYMQTYPIYGPSWLLPVGVMYPGFATSDYFPLLPNLGYFLLGAVLGHTIYHKRSTLFPKVDTNLPPIRFLCACGRHSLLIYLLHQPIFSAAFALLAYIN